MERFSGTVWQLENVHWRFSQWAQSGVPEAVFAHLASDVDNEYSIIDSTIVPAQQHSAGRFKKDQKQAIGRSEAGLSTKFHATMDALGNLTEFHLTGGQACDLDGADVLLPDISAKTVQAYKVYDADARVIEPLDHAGKTAVIPTKCSRKNRRFCSKHQYKARYSIENFFGKLKPFRAIAILYEKIACNFLAVIVLAAATLWMT